MLTGNLDIAGAVQSVRELEDRFNYKYNYPWVFLNDQPFSDEFKSCVLVSPLGYPYVLTRYRPTSRVSILASGPVHFGRIPDDHWNQPSWLNATKVQEQMQKMDGIPRAGSISWGFDIFLVYVRILLMRYARLDIIICADSTLEYDLLFS
jgi:alpha 1,2-mannosyltransferase